MKFVTWQNVGVDRMACAWAISRFIDSRAEFSFVAEGQKLAALPEGMEPFDIPGARLSHHGGHCSFFALLDEYHLDDPILRRIARMIDEADTVQVAAVEPASAGLDLLCRGIRRISPDDRTAIERGALLYDALYSALEEEFPTRSTGENR
jgi:hypothetical protein